VVGIRHRAFQTHAGAARGGLRSLSGLPVDSRQLGGFGRPIRG
jgi:hypothetical protein